MSALTLVQTDPPLGWSPHEGITQEQFAAEFQANLLAFDTVENLTPFVVGDQFNKGVELYGYEFVASLIDPEEQNPDTVFHWAYVALVFPPFRRLKQVRKYGVYQALAGIPADDLRWELLELAAAENWKVQDARLMAKNFMEPSTKALSALPSELSVDTVWLRTLLDNVNEVLPRLKLKSKVIPAEVQAIEDCLNKAFEKGIWTGVVS